MKPERDPLSQHPPEGQPYANPRITTVISEGQKHPVFVHPHHVVTVRSKGELLAVLKHYAHPFPMMENTGHHHKTSVRALRYLIEWTYPALRWYCKVYGVAVPDWLEGNGWADGMDTEDLQKFVGEEPLNVFEFTERQAHAGKRS